MARCRNVSKWITTACLAFQTLVIVERQVFDFLGSLWSCVIANFVEIAFTLVGMYGAIQSQLVAVLLYILVSVCWLGWNIFLICFYSGVGILNDDSSVLNMGAGGRSWWIAKGFRCPPPHHPKDPSLVKASEGCVELVHSAFQLLWTTVCIVSAILSLKTKTVPQQPTCQSIEDELEYIHMSRPKAGELNRCFSGRSAARSTGLGEEDQSESTSRDDLISREGNFSRTSSGGESVEGGGRYLRGHKRSHSGPVTSKSSSGGRHDQLRRYQQSLENIFSNHPHSRSPIIGIDGGYTDEGCNPQSAQGAHGYHASGISDPPSSQGVYNSYTSGSYYLSSFPNMQGSYAGRSDDPRSYQDVRIYETSAVSSANDSGRRVLNSRRFGDMEMRRGSFDDGIHVRPNRLQSPHESHLLHASQGNGNYVPVPLPRSSHFQNTDPPGGRSILTTEPVRGERRTLRPRADQSVSSPTYFERTRNVRLPQLSPDSDDSQTPRVLRRGGNFRSSYRKITEYIDDNSGPSAKDSERFSPPIGMATRSTRDAGRNNSRRDLNLAFHSGEPTYPSGQERNPTANMGSQRTTSATFV